MRQRSIWHGAVLVALCLVIGTFSSGQGGFANPAAAAGSAAGSAATTPAVPERYNPYVSGNRVVFTQVERKPDGSTTAGVWARDLASGAETLVANVGTGEPFPVTNDRWTAWSESPALDTTAVRVRANNAGPIIDVFTTAWSPQWEGDHDSNLPLALSSNNLATTNGKILGPDVPELVRFSLPNPLPTYVDVMTTAPNFSTADVAQTGATTVLAEDSSVLFSVVDGRGQVVSAPAAASDGCQPMFFQPQRGFIVADGNRIGYLTFCAAPDGGNHLAVATCTLPCQDVEPIFFDNPHPEFSFPNGLTLSDNRFFFTTSSGFAGSTIYELDAVPGATAKPVRTTTNLVGPRISVSGNTLVWDESGYRDGVLTAEIYVRDLTTGKTRVLRPNGADASVAAPTGPIRHDPDVRGNQVVYAESARDRSSAGIWVRNLNGQPRLVSPVATDSSMPRLGNRWVAWNTHDDGDAIDRVYAMNTSGGPLIDVYHTDLGPFGFPGFVFPAAVDVSGRQAVVSAETAASGFGFQQVVLSKRLPNGPLVNLTPPLVDYGARPGELAARTEGRYTASLALSGFGVGGSVLLRDGRTERSLALPPGPFGSCMASYLDVTTTNVVVAPYCFDSSTATLASCALPCDGALTNVIDLTTEVFPQFGWTLAPQVIGLSASGSKVAVLRAGNWLAGRYLDRQGVRNFVEVYDLAHPDRAPVAITADSGKISEPRIDGDTVVFSIQRESDGPSGVLYRYDLRPGTLTAL